MSTIDDQLAQAAAHHPIRSWAYRVALRQMFRLRPEKIHVLMTKGLGILQNMPAVHRTLERYWAVHDPALEQEVFGVTFPRPLGLAAGFDKNATSPDVWAPIGFGYAELGTITAQGQPGNPTPRLFRLKEDHAILNRMGFNNQGAAACVQRIARRRTTDIIGINIGKTKIVEAKDAANDYRMSARLLAHHADYLVINVSSPNTPGLRDLQAVESLRPIIAAVQEEADSTPVLVKIAPDLSNDDVIAVADLALEMGLAGIVATNTTISREGLSADPQYIKDLGAGGISGRPEAARALEVLSLLYSHVGDKLVLIGVGGIESPQQAWERIGAGATLLQGYTPFIYGGPDWIRDIHLGLARQVKAHGLTNIGQAVGKGLPWVD